MDLKIPKEIIFAIKTLNKAGFEAYLVGGCVRDLLEIKKPNDWDIATNATPKEIQRLFKKSFYDNKFLTVKVITDSKDPTLKEIEITTFRSETNYTDHRHPDKVKPAKTIEEDLSRRDFTVNAMAMRLNSKKEIQNSKQVFGSQKTNSKSFNFKSSNLDKVSSFEFRISNFYIIDPFGGQKDLKNKIIRAVGDPKERFSEDALRLLRAVRFATTLGENWKIEEKTKKAIKESAHLLQKISKERIKEELEKIIMSPFAYEGFLLLHKTGLLKYIIPKLEMGVGVSQNRHHIYTIFEHSLLSLKYAAKYNYSLEVRLSALLHDIAKPQTKRGEWPDATFYNHDIVGAKIARNILYQLRFPKKVVDKVELLVKNHMFFYDPEVVTEYSVRKLLRKVGKENIKDLLCLRIADRKGSGVPKAKPYRLRHLEYMIEKVSRDPISVQMLKVNGNDVMETLNIQPGPRVGLILNALLAEVLESPEKNNKNYLLKRIKELGKMSEENLKKAGKIVEEKKMEIEEELKRKYWVK